MYKGVEGWKEAHTEEQSRVSHRPGVHVVGLHLEGNPWGEHVNTQVRVKLTTFWLWSEPLNHHAPPTQSMVYFSLFISLRFIDICILIMDEHWFLNLI